MKCLLQTGTVLVEQVEQANTFFSRLKGLMFRKGLPQGMGLLLEPCPQIHTCFMRFSIDVIFLDKENKVVAVLENLKPWRMSKFHPQAYRTLEMPSGSLRQSIHIGDQINFIN